MKRKNLYHIDDICIVLSFLLIIPFVMVFLPVLSVLPQIQRGDVNLTGFLRIIWEENSLRLSLLGGSIVFLQALGRYVRRKENVTLDIMDKIMKYKSISIHQLQNDLNKEQNVLEKYIKDIQKNGFLGIRYDGMYVHLDLSPPEGDEYSSFGYDSSAEVGGSLGSSESHQPEFPPGSSSDFNPLSQNPPASMGHQGRPGEYSKEEIIKYIQQIQQGKAGGGQFNIGVFIFLMILFPPIAIIYMVFSLMKSQNKNYVIQKFKHEIDKQE